MTGLGPVGGVRPWSQRGHTQQFLTMPKGAECCGPIIMRDRVLIAPQHPGDEMSGATADSPGSA